MSDKVKNEIVKKEESQLLEEIDDVVLPSSPTIIQKLKDNLFEKDIHYSISKKNGEEVIFFKKQASSVLAELFGVSVKIIRIETESFLPPSAQFIIERTLKLSENLFNKGKNREAGKLIEFAKDLAMEKNPADWYRVTAYIEISNGKRNLQWVASATNALENSAVAMAMTRAFRNGLRSFIGL